MGMSDSAYRAQKEDSYSSIKSFLDDRVKYYKKYILGQKVTEEDEHTNSNLRMGSLVDSLLLSPGLVEEKFTLTSSEAPTGQMLTFVENLYRRTSDALDGEILTKSLDSLIDEAYSDTKYDRNGEMVAFKRKTLDTVKEDFLIKKVGFDYYLALRDKEAKIVITQDELQRANQMISTLNTHEYTRDIMREPAENQVMLKGVYNGLPVKGMVDKVIIRDGVVYPYDLKTTWNVEQFDYNYLKYRYYIQNVLYTSLLRDFYGEEYEVRPMAFIVTDKLLYMDPIVYETEEKHLTEAKNGFWAKGMEYVGLDKAVEDIIYHTSTGQWRTSADLQRTKGRSKIKLYGV